jgi:Predicted membrane protein (DUF2207) C-terminal domain/Predicted membrane protein (DUF2207) N-terminal domain
MRRVSVAVALLLVLAVPARGDEGWLIERLEFALAIQEDGSIEALEALDVDFRGLERHGIFRDIVSVQSYDETTNRRYDLRLSGVTNAEGQRHEVRTSTEGAVTRFRIGDPDRTVSGRETYRIAYTLRGALNAFPDHDELYWNATGTWPVSVSSAVVRVTAPFDSIQRVACYEGAQGSTDPCQATLSRGEAVFTATRPLVEGEQMTIVAALRKGAVPEPAPILVTRPRDLFHFFDRTPIYVGSMLLGFAAVFGGVGLLWWKVGRDRRYTSMHYLSQDTTEERVPLLASDPVVVEFEPPDHIRPGQMGLLFDERADTLDVTATIIDLAVRGYLKITELPKASVLALFGKPDYRLERLKDNDHDLLEYERIVLDGLFGSPTTKRVNLSDIRNTFYKDLEKAKQALYKDALARGWFPRKPTTVRGIWIGVGILIDTIGTGLMIVLGMWWGAGLVALPVMAAGTLLVMFSGAMPRRTAAGREALRRSKGFARYINTAEKHQQAFAERANLFTAYLPYAIAMKAVTKWAKAFKDVDLQRTTSTWYVGTRQFDPDTFASNISTFSSSVSSAIASTPGGSGGSGFGGGGSSGGGGGGGGGGSW